MDKFERDKIERLLWNKNHKDGLRERERDRERDRDRERERERERITYEYFVTSTGKAGILYK